VVLGAGVGLALLVRPEPPPPPTGAWMERAGVSPRVVTAAGHRLRYVRQGTGPTVVLLHGFASSVYTWAEVLPVLAQAHDVVALDLPGFGGSEIPGDLTMADYPRTVSAFLEAVGVARASIVGHSLGGALACVLAAREPDRVARLVLIDAAGFNLAPADRPWLLRAVAAVPPAVLHRVPIRRRLVALGLHQVFHDDRRVTHERIDEYWAPLARPGAARAASAVLRTPEGLGLPGVISVVRAPTLVIWGRQDTWVPVRDAQRFAAAIPGARVELLDNCGHMPQEEQPAELARLMMEFLATGRVH
jgi:pimeloyl-ACP methyl ester carboxylesterase